MRFKNGILEGNYITEENAYKAIELAEKDVIERAAEWMKLYVLNHDTIDIFEMEDEFKKSMMEE